MPVGALAKGHSLGSSGRDELVRVISRESKLATCLNTHIRFSERFDTSASNAARSLVPACMCF
jgi:hypothetical protein